MVYTISDNLVLWARKVEKSSIYETIAIIIMGSFFLFLMVREGLSNLPLLLIAGLGLLGYFIFAIYTGTVLRGETVNHTILTAELKNEHLHITTLPYRILLLKSLHTQKTHVKICDLKTSVKAYPIMDKKHIANDAIVLSINNVNYYYLPEFFKPEATALLFPLLKKRNE